MKSRGGTLGAGGLDAPAFVAPPARALRRGSGRTRRGRAGEAGRARVWRGRAGAGAGRCAAAGGAGGGWASAGAGGRRAGRVRADGWPATWYLFGSATPWIRARHCRAKIGGVARAATSTITETGRRHWRPLPRHHAWRGIGIWPRQDNRRGQKC